MRTWHVECGDRDLDRFTVELQTGRSLLTFSRGEKVAEGRMRGFQGPAQVPSPHPPLRGTFSRGEKV